MVATDYILALNDISAYQGGLLTTAQAEATGVPRHALSRLEKKGLLERLAKGIYRMGGAPATREGDVLAVWLSLNPNRDPGSSVDGPGTIVACGATAAWLLGLGEVGPEPYEFSCAERRQTHRSNVILHKRAYQPSEVTVVGGVPVTIPTRTVLDLAASDEDPSLVANVLTDALPGLSPGDREVLAGRLDELKRSPRRGACAAPLTAMLVG